MNMKKDFLKISKKIRDLTKVFNKSIIIKLPALFINLKAVMGRSTFRKEKTMKTTNRPNILAALVIIGLAACGGGGSSPAPVPVVFTATAQSAPCWDGKTQSGDGTGATQQAANDAAQFAANAKYPQGCAATASTGVAVSQTAGKLTLAGLSPQAKLSSGSIAATSAAGTLVMSVSSAAAISVSSGTLAYAATYSYTGDGALLKFSNAPDLKIAGTFVSEGWMDAQIRSGYGFAGGVILTEPQAVVDMRSVDFLDAAYNASVLSGAVLATEWDVIFEGRRMVTAYFKIDTPNSAGVLQRRWCATPVYRDTGDTIRGVDKHTRSCFGNDSEIFRIRTLSGGGVVLDTFSNGQRVCGRINWTGLQFSTGTPVDCVKME